MSKKKINDAEVANTPTEVKAASGKKSSAKSATATKAIAGASGAKDATPASEPARKKATKKSSEAGAPLRKSAKTAAAVKAPAVQASASPVAPEATPKTVNAAAPGLKPPSTVQAPPPIQDEEIARLAYSYAEARGFQGGSPDADWFRAKQALLRLRGH